MIVDLPELDGGVRLLLHRLLGSLTLAQLGVPGAHLLDFSIVLTQWKEARIHGNFSMHAAVSVSNRSLGRQFQDVRSVPL